MFPSSPGNVTRLPGQNYLDMKKLSVIILLVAAALGFAAGATPKGAPGQITGRITASEAFIDMPPSVLELLSRFARMNMVEYWEADSVYRCTNAMDGVSYIEAMDSSYMRVALTQVSRMEIKILPGRKGNVVGVSYTVDSNGQQADSQLFFFDAQMQPLKIDKMLRAPKVKDFFKIEKGSLTKMDELVAMVQFPTIEYRFSPDNTNLEGRLTVGQYIDVDDYNIMKLFLLPQLTWQWDGKGYKLQK